MKKPRKAKGESRNIVDKAFSLRLDKACDDNPHIPPKNHGRLGYIADKFYEIAKDKISKETVWKWFYGEARPRPIKMKILARVLEVDEAWLSLGMVPELQPRERGKRNVALGGAVDFVSSVIQMDGGTVSFVEEKDPRKEYVHIYAIIKGAMYPIHAALDSGKDKNHKFVVPTQFADCTILGVVRGEGTNFDLLHLESEAIEKHGDRRGGFMEVEVARTGPHQFAAIGGKEKTKLRVIPNFLNRI